MTSGLLIAVVLWPACWHALARRLRSRGGMSRARQLAAVVGYDVLTWAWAVLLLGFLPAMTARLEGIGAGVEIAVAALVGAALTPRSPGAGCGGYCAACGRTGAW